MIKMMQTILILTMPLLLIGASPTTQPEVKTKIVSEPLPSVIQTYYPGMEKYLDDCHYVAVFRGIMTAAKDEYELRELFIKIVENAPAEMFSSDANRNFFMNIQRTGLFQMAPTKEVYLMGEANTGKKVFRQNSDKWWIFIPCRGMTGPYIKIEDALVERPIYEFRILASTPESAEALAKDFIRLYNQCLVESERKKMIQAIKEEKERQPQWIEQLNKTRKQLTAIESQLRVYPEEIKTETINTLETQKWLVSVDIAGVQARIEAIQKLQTQKKSNSSTQKELEENQIVAQIDLVDFLARQDKINSILTSSEKRNYLQSELKRIKNKLNELSLTQEAGEQKIKDLTFNLDSWYFQPFRPIDNTITVQPIELPKSTTQPAK
jgi:hypothetical protein